MRFMTANMHGALQAFGGLTMISVPPLVAAAEPVGVLHAVVGGLQVGGVVMAQILRHGMRAHFQDDRELAESAEWLDALHLDALDEEGKR